MKKLLTNDFLLKGRKCKKFLLIMRLSLILTFATLLNATASVYSQSVKVNLDLKNATLETVFKSIQDQTEFDFFYKNDQLPQNKVITKNYENTRVDQILDEVLEGTGLIYRVLNTDIVVTKGTTRSSSQRGNNIVAQQQTKTITGTVTDENGQPLPGVTVVVKGTTTGTVTNADGEFNLQIPLNSESLTFSFVGFKSQEIQIGSTTNFDIQMVQDVIGLDEVVAVGYGTMKRSDLTGAISSVSGSDLAETLSPNLLEQAQGRLAGVDIVKNNGSPGSPSTIRIRGNRSINASNDPLYVIDGIPTSLSISDFNPRDIESVEVLKDASAVAIYGSRGANGVILITTKRGKEGKTVIESNNYYGVKSAIENIDLMNGQQFAEYVRIARGLERNDNSQDETILGELQTENLRQGFDTNWLDLILKTGKQQEHQVSFSGGNQAVNYYISGSYYVEEGVVKKSDFERFSIRTNIDGRFSEKLKVGVSLTASTDLRNQMSNAPLGNAITYNPLINPYDDEGNIIPYPNPLEGLVASPLLNYAPNQYFDETKGYRFFSNLFGEYNLTNDFSYRLNFGTDVRYSRRGQFNGDYDGSLSSGSITNNLTFAYTLENIFTYEKIFGDHALNLVGLFSTQKQSSENSSLSGRGIPITRSKYYDLGSSGEITGIGSGLSEWGLLSYMGRVNYRFKDRYLLTISGRADGSSRLAEGNKWDFFPATSVAWIISEEDFFNFPTLSFLKFRAGYGQVGNTAIQPYQTLGGLDRTVYAYGDEGAFGFGHSGIANPLLGWEVSKTTNIGVDFGLLDGKISGTMEYYDTKTEDLLLQRLLPISSGFSSVLENVGATRNRGWELTLSFNVINNNSGFRWDIDANIFANKEEIVELFKGTEDDVGNRWFIGHPINVFYDYEFDGIWQQDEVDQAAEYGQKPGDIKIMDINGRDEEGNLTKKPDGIINSDDRMILGSTVPDWSGGLTNRISYKGFNFSMLIYTRQGQMLNSSLHDLGGNNWEGRRARLNFNYWTPDNPSNEIPIPRWGGTPLYASAVRYFDGSFVKIKNITLGYDLAQELFNFNNISSMQLYLSALNPIFISKYDFLDPETASGNVGVNNYWSSATYMIGLNLKF
jgi:TonB-linked SusC/RagA family outer membrane protein